MMTDKNIINARIFEYGDVDAAEYLIVSILESLRQNESLTETQRVFLIKALERTIEMPNDLKLAFGLTRKNKKGNFTGNDEWKQNRDHLLYLYELKFRKNGLRGDELYAAIQEALYPFLTIDPRSVQRAKQRVKHEYQDIPDKTEVIDRYIKAYRDLVIS